MEQWLNPAALGSLGTLLTAIVGAIYMVVKDQRSGKIEIRTAEDATSTSLATASKISIDTMSDVNAHLVTWVKSVEEDLNTERLTTSAWRRWYRNLKKNWDVLRQLDTPPDEPDTSEGA